MKKLVFIGCTFGICLIINTMVFNLSGTHKNNLAINENIHFKTKNAGIKDKNINIVKIPLPNVDQRKYDVKKLPSNSGKIELKKLNNK